MASSLSMTLQTSS